MFTLLGELHPHISIQVQFHQFRETRTFPANLWTMPKNVPCQNQLVIPKMASKLNTPLWVGTLCKRLAIMWRSFEILWQKSFSIPLGNIQLKRIYFCTASRGCTILYKEGSRWQQGGINNIDYYFHDFFIILVPTKSNLHNWVGLKLQG